MELISTKIIALTLLGALTLFFGLLPLRVRKYLTQGSRKRERIISCCLCFGGGVLLATVFTHMLPETRENFDIAFAKNFITAGEDYPLAELVVCAGFFLIYVVEEFVHKLTKDTGAGEEKGSSSSSHSHHHHHHHHHNHHRHHHGHNHNNVHKMENLDGAKQLRRESGRCSVYSITEAAKKGESVGVGGGGGGQEVLALSPKNKWAETGVDNPVFAGDADAVTWNPVLKETIVTSSQVVPSNNNSTTTTTTAVTEAFDSGAMSGGRGGAHHNHAHILTESDGCHSHTDISKICSKGIAEQLRSIIIILALSIHSVFEGLAVGLQERIVDVWYLFGAIAAHKFVIAFCVGIKLLSDCTSVGLMVIYMVVLALVTPFGIAIGILVTESITGDPGSHLVLVTVLQGLAGGTILYVTFFEILEKERARRGGRLLKLLFVLIGFAVMASMEAFGAHSHGPMGEGDHGSHAGHSHGGHSHGSHGSLKGQSDHLFDSKAPLPNFLANDHHHDHHDHDHDNNNFHVSEKPLADLVENGRRGGVQDGGHDLDFLTEPPVDRLVTNTHEEHSHHDHHTDEVTGTPPDPFFTTTQEDRHNHDHDHHQDHNHDHHDDHSHDHHDDHNHDHSQDHNHDHHEEHNHGDHTHEHSEHETHDHKSHSNKH